MKNFKRTLAFISALSIVGTLSACSDSGEQTPEATLAATVETTAPKELSDEEKESVAAVDVGDDEKLENGKVRWLATYDINPAKGKPKDFSLELFETKYGGSHLGKPLHRPFHSRSRRRRSRYVPRTRI